MKILIKRVIIGILRKIASIWLNPKYLHGKNYDDVFVGWKWVLRSFFFQYLLGINKHVPWPLSPSSAVDEPDNLFFDVDDAACFMHFGCYFSNCKGGKITIGKGTMIAPNVGIITTNHNLEDPAKHQPPLDVIIGQNCWIGMGAVILPGVHLGDNTVVGANSLVSKSFIEGNVVIAGNPARVIKNIIHVK